MPNNSKPEFVFRVHNGGVQFRVNKPGHCWIYAQPIVADAYTAGFHAGAFHAGQACSCAFARQVSDLCAHAVSQLLSEPSEATPSPRG